MGTIRWRGDQSRRRRDMPPRPIRPVASKASVPGSGTALTSPTSSKVEVCSSGLVHSVFENAPGEPLASAKCRSDTVTPASVNDRFARSASVRPVMWSAPRLVIVRLNCSVSWELLGAVKWTVRL